MQDELDGLVGELDTPTSTSEVILSNKVRV